MVGIIIEGLFILSVTSSAAKIGIIVNVSPTSWQYLFKIGSAINIAHDQLVSDGVLARDTNIR